MSLQKKDFVEIEFTGKVKNSGVFDTNIEEEAKKIGIEIKTRPLIICLGEGMILPAIDEFLISKELGSYVLELKPEKAFGIRKRELIKIMPSNVFKKQGMAPSIGMVFSFDNTLGRVSSVSGGRITIDFNNPLAGKEVVYEIKTKRKVDEINEKIKTLELYFFQKEFPFKVEEKKLVIEAGKKFCEFIKMFKEKFKEILDLEIMVEEVEEEEKSSVEENPEKKTEESGKIEKTAENDSKIS